MTHPEAHEDIRQRFDDELEEIQRHTLELGALVLENTRRCVDAVLENRLDLAQEAIDADQEIDEKYAATEYNVFQIMALQQPVAGDLRFLIAVARMLYEIERSGDLAVNIAKGLVRLDGYALPSALQALVARIGRGTVDVFSLALDAFTDMEPDAGNRLDDADDVVDTAVKELYNAIAAEENDVPLEVAIELSRVGRYLERIADHGVGIGDHTTFIVTGEFAPPAGNLGDERESS